MELELLTRLCPVIKLKHEAKDVIRVDETDNDDISRVRNIVIEDCIADARLDELNRRAFLGAVEYFRLLGRASQRPEIAVVVFQDL